MTANAQRWNNQNTAHLGATERGALIDTANQIYAEHGRDPCTKQQAAAHEAGHVLVARALGEVITGARIWQTPQGWVGANLRDGDPEPRPLAVDPKFAFTQSCIGLAGVAGEIFAGCYHPASSVDEIWIAEGVCRALDEHLGARPGATLDAAKTIVQRVFDINATTHYALTAHLMRDRRVFGAVLDRMLAKVAVVKGVQV